MEKIIIVRHGISHEVESWKCSKGDNVNCKCCRPHWTLAPHELTAEESKQYLSNSES